MHQTNRQPLGQFVFCKGCCCGRTERGMPEVPVERLKAVWQSEKLNRSVQLTISGCLGPCDVANVVLLLSPRWTAWLGRIEGEDFDLLIDWARRCHAAGVLQPLPASLAPHQLQRFAPDGIKVS